MKKTNRILIIDDNEHVRDILKSIVNQANTKSEKVAMLKKSLFDKEGEQQPAPMDFRIDEASQGSDAIEMAKQAFNEGDPYFLVISDVRMPPGIDGIETIMGIRKVDPGIAVLIITAYSDYSEGELLAKFNGNGFLLLMKPFDDEDIINFVLSIREE